MRSVPSIHIGKVSLSWEYLEAGRLQYLLRGQNGRILKVPPATVLLLFAADGSRSLNEIYKTGLSWGVPIEEPADLVLVFRKMESFSIVEMDWHVSVGGALAHRCWGCGRSCEGHLVGPLGQSDVARLSRIKGELTERDVQLAPGPATMEIRDPQVGARHYLNIVQGRCVFLNEERQCAIHKHFGADKKPVSCRLFPLRVISTESGFRVGVLGRCGMRHRAVKGEEPGPIEAIFSALNVKTPPGAAVGLDPRNRRSFKTSAVTKRNHEQEAFYLDLLGRPEISLGQFMASIDGTERLKNPPPVFIQELSRRLRAVPLRYVPSPLIGAGTEIASDIDAFFEDLNRLIPSESSWVSVPASVEYYIKDLVSQAVFTRDIALHGEISLGVSMVMAGIVGAIWTTTSWVEKGGAVSDELGVRVACWMRIINNSAAVSLLFDSADDYRGCLGLLRE